MSLVRINCKTYQLKEGESEKLISLWPKLKEWTKEKSWNFSCEEQIIDIEDIPGDIIEIEAIEFKPLKKVQFVRAAPNFNLSDFSQVKEFTKSVSQIVMPGYDLLKYGAIHVEENACTDVMQKKLDEGWRIIAVLPRLDQRRPDYILVKEAK